MDQVAERGPLKFWTSSGGPEEVAERGLLEVLDLVWGPEEVTERGPLELWTSSGDLKKSPNEG